MIGVDRQISRAMLFSTIDIDVFLMPPRAICQTREIFELPMTSERLFRLIEMVKARVQGE